MRLLLACRNGLKTWGCCSTSPLLSARHGLTARRVSRIHYSPRFVCRTFASSIAPPALVEDVVEVPVGGNGSITLHVLRPATNTTEANPKVILYLPRGPIFQHESSAPGIKDSRTVDYPDTHDVVSSPFGNALSTAQEVMAAVTGANVITLNYRLGYTDERAKIAGLDKDRARTLYRYPTPVHDTLAGLDWILQNIRPEQLFVFGSNIGGSLAISLALTESDHIHAVATHEPVCDWTSLDEHCIMDQEILTETENSTYQTSKVIAEDFEHEQKPPAKSVQVKQNSRRKKKAAPSDLVSLLKTRECLFDSPSKYFDAFASPMLFLRSAGKDVPKTMPQYLTGPKYPIPVLKSPIIEDDMDLWDIFMQVEDDIPPSVENSTQEEERPSRRRKALSRWPPYGLDHGNASSRGFSKATRMQITLPYVKFFARLSSTEESSALSHPGWNGAVTDVEGVEIARPKQRSRKSTADNNSVLGMQAKDMVSVMRRACFWGEEAGNGEERVTLRSLPQTATADDDTVEQQHQLTDPDYLETVYETAYWFRELIYYESQSS